MEDKLKIAAKLDYLGVSYIEGGWPGSNPKDLEFFRRMQEIDLVHAQVTAFSSTCKPGVSVTRDANMKALVEAGTCTVTIFGKSWDFHVLRALETSLVENLHMVRDTVSYCKDLGKEVIFDLEHFFDGYKNNPDYALQVLAAAAEAGADWLVLCDTNGGLLPWEMEEIITRVKAEVSSPLGVHLHNDGACGVANSLVAVRMGAGQVQGTMNGYGERCGNADLSAVIPDVELKMGKKCLPPGHLVRLTEVSHYVSEVANMPRHTNQPFVGHGAFAHKGGVHVSALLKDPATYEHINPQTVGNRRRVLVSELSGVSNLAYKARELNLNLDGGDGETRKVIQQIKELENQGFQFEGAEASLELLLRKARGEYRDFFQFQNLKIIIEKREDNGIAAEAMIKLTVDGKTVHTAAEGEGPVNALDNALRKALTECYPFIKEMHLTDYKVRVLDGSEGTAAKVRVLVESSDEKETWSTVGVSENIIEASWQAVVDSLNYMFLRRLTS